MEEQSNGEIAFINNLSKRKFHWNWNLILCSRFFTASSTEEENNWELPFLDNLLKAAHTDQYLRYGYQHQTSCKESLVSSLLNRAYSIIINKDDLCKENARIKQVLKKNGYQENIISKIFKRITNNYSLPQSQQQTQGTYIQEEEIRMSILRSDKIRSTFYTENTLHKLLCKPKYGVDEHGVQMNTKDLPGIAIVIRMKAA